MHVSDRIVAWTVGAVGAFGPFAAVFARATAPEPLPHASITEPSSRIELCGKVGRYVPANREDGALVLDGRPLKLARGTTVKDERLLALNRPVCVSGILDKADRLVECTASPICTGDGCSGPAASVDAGRTGPSRLATK